MNSETLGDRLKVVRKYLELNQEEVSQKLQITNQTLSRYEKGTRFPDSQFLRRFGSMFNVNANWLLYGIGDLFLDDAGQPPLSEEDFMKQICYLTKRIEDTVKGLIKGK